MSLKYNKKNVVLARNLRKRATRTDKRLWYDFLSKYPVRFQRQKAIDNFIADFYCHEASLVIELDGTQHYTDVGEIKDSFRTEILKGYDLKVIRFSNYAVKKNFQGVCRYIHETVQELIGKNQSS